MNQNDIYMALGVLVGMSMLAGMFLDRSVGQIIHLYYLLKNRNQFPRVRKFVETTLCKDAHAWQETQLMMMDISPGPHKVCSKCGFVAGSKKQLNQSGLQAMKENLEMRQNLRTREERMIFRVSEIYKADRDMWIKTNIGKFGRDPEKNIVLLEKFSDRMVESLDAASRRAFGEDKVK